MGLPGGTPPERSSADRRSIDRRIMAALDSLTQSEQRLARVVLETQPILASFTAAELAGRAQVSNATAARFFQHLGYSSFNEARRQARDSQPVGAWFAQDGDDGEPCGPSRAFARHIEQDRANLAGTSQAIAGAELQAAADCLADAATVWVAGFGAAAPLAALARVRLLEAKPDVRSLQEPGLAEGLTAMGPGHALLALSFGGDPSDGAVWQAACQAGAALILLYDEREPCGGSRATVALPCHRNGLGASASDVASVSVIAHLSQQVEAALGAASGDRRRDIGAMREYLGASAPRRPGRRATA